MSGVDLNAAMTGHAFWNTIDELFVNSYIVIDRPKGSRHPRYADIIYPLDYGYLGDTTSADGDGIDVWLGSDPRRQVVGVVCTIDVVKRDSEVKLLLGCTDTEIETICAFHNTNFMGCLLIPSPLLQDAAAKPSIVQDD